MVQLCSGKSTFCQILLETGLLKGASVLVIAPNEFLRDDIRRRRPP
jgi:hypothetical protein